MNEVCPIQPPQVANLVLLKIPFTSSGKKYERQLPLDDLVCPRHIVGAARSRCKFLNFSASEDPHYGTLTMDASASELTLATKVQYLPGVGPQRAEKLAKLGIRNVRDLVFFFPRQYEHPAPPTNVDRLKEGVEASLVGVVTDAELVSRTPGKSVFGAVLQTETGAVRILFFNQPFRAETITFDRHLMISGAPKLNGLRWEFVHPQVTLLDSDEDVPKPRILPVYPLTDGVKQADLRKLTTPIVEQLSDSLTEVLPEILRCKAADSLRRFDVDVGRTVAGTYESDYRNPSTIIGGATQHCTYPICFSRAFGDATRTGDASASTDNGLAIPFDEFLSDHQCSNSQSLSL